MGDRSRVFRLVLGGGGGAGGRQKGCRGSVDQVNYSAISVSHFGNKLLEKQNQTLFKPV